VLRGHSGLEALGGGSFEEVVRPPLGNCSINTLERHRVSPREIEDLGRRNLVGGSVRGRPEVEIELPFALKPVDRVRNTSAGRSSKVLAGSAAGRAYASPVCTASAIDPSILSAL
jgi:hypothetical protein